MYPNPFVDQLLAEERRKDVMRQKSHARLIRVVKASEESWGWRLPMILGLKSLLTLDVSVAEKYGESNV
jgi:hypothetical protein